MGAWCRLRFGHWQALEPLYTSGDQNEEIMAYSWKDLHGA